MNEESPGKNINPNLSIAETQDILNNKVSQKVENQPTESESVRKLKSVLEVASSNKSEGEKHALISNIKSGATFLNEIVAEKNVPEKKFDTLVPEETRIMRGVFKPQISGPTIAEQNPSIEKTPETSMVSPAQEALSSLEELITDPSMLEGEATSRHTPEMIIKEALQQ